MKYKKKNPHASGHHRFCRLSRLSYGACTCPTYLTDKVRVTRTNHYMSRKQSGYIMGLERRSGHQIRWISRNAGGMRKPDAEVRIMDLLARLGGGDVSDIDDELHASDCTGCRLDRL